MGDQLKIAVQAVTNIQTLHTLVFMGGRLKLHPDGRIEMAPGLNADDAARGFLDALAVMFPTLLKRSDDPIAALDAWGGNWVAARGRLHDSEPDYAVQLLSGDGVEAEGEGETLFEAVAAARAEAGS